MKYNKRNGNTLLELMVYISVAIMIISISMSVYISTCDVFKKCVSMSLSLNEIQEVFIDIDNIVKDKDVQKISVIGNSIYVYVKKEVANLIKVITIQGDILRIKYYYEDSNGNYLTYSSPNNLITGIEGFRVTEKSKLIYITIQKEGKYYKKCL